MIRVSQGTKEDMSKKGEKRFNGKTMLGITILNMVTHNYSLSTWETEAEGSEIGV